jgi:glyoxylase-like metal-dependent hydrolase (beta-lactamase superfamily II)
MKSLSKAGVSPGEIDYIVLTHIHIDHAGGVGRALREMTNARVIAHPRAQKHLADPQTLWKASVATLGELALQYGSIEPIPEERIIAASDLMELDLGGDTVLKLYHTPGHAPHHLSVFAQNDNLLMVGEAAGVCINGIIRPATPPPFKLEETLSSIDRLIAIGPELLCYGHFGCYDHAVEKLQFVRNQILTWHQIVNSAAKSGKNPDEILMIIKQADRSLDYLDSLSSVQYERDHTLLINSIVGMTESRKIT